MHRYNLLDIARLKIAHVVTALLVEQWCNNTVIMAELFIVQRTMLFTIVCFIVLFCLLLFYLQCYLSLMKQQRLLKQEKTILIEQACSLLLSLL